jgi:hypothetical protein
MQRRVSLLVLAAVAIVLAACGSNDTKLKITGIEPNTGDVEGGQYVRIYGNRFVADGVRNAKVYFGTRQGTVDRFVSDGEMVVQAPGGKSNETVDVLVIFEPGGELKIPHGFTFIDKHETNMSVDELTGAGSDKKK